MVELITQHVVGNDRVDDSEGQTSLNGQVNIVFGNHHMSPNSKHLDSQVHCPHVLGTGVQEVEPGFKQPTEPAKTFHQSGYN